MGRKVNSFDVAKHAGVSQATVSYVLNGRYDLRIRQETRDKVLEAARDLGYQPNLSARSLALGSTRTIALWVPFSYYSVFNHVIEQVMRLARDSQFHVVIAQWTSESEESLLGLGNYSGANVDAVIALDARELVERILDSAPGAPPIISIGPAYSLRTDHVGVDLPCGSRLAVHHLLEIGCDRIAIAGHRDHMHVGDPRFRAYVEAMQAHGRPIEPIPCANDDSEHAHEAVKEYFQAGGRPDGIFCWNDSAAIGANRALADLGIRVPDEVAIIGSDGIRDAQFCVPALSTVAQPFQEMCELAWQYLQDRLTDPARPVQGTLLPMTLVARASTARLVAAR